MSALLSKVGINSSATSEKVGTAAIAYAAHKALSPVRFPPTVALTLWWPGSWATRGSRTMQNPMSAMAMVPLPEFQ